MHATPCYADDAILFSIMVRRSTFEQVFWKQLPESSLLASFFRKALSGDDKASWLYFDTQSDEELQDLCARMEQAAALLSQGDLPIALVGSQVGYADNSSFYRAFTQYYGKTPKDYRTGNRT